MSVQTYRVKAEAKIEEYQAKLDVARAKLKGAKADAQVDLERQVREIDKKLAIAKKRTRELADAADDAWSDVTRGLDDAFEGMTGAVKRFFSRSD